MAPGYYWARDRAQSVEGWKIVEVIEFGYGEQIVQCIGSDCTFDVAEWDFGPRVKGQDEDSEA